MAPSSALAPPAPLLLLLFLLLLPAAQLVLPGPAPALRPNIFGTRGLQGAPETLKIYPGRARNEWSLGHTGYVFRRSLRKPRICINFVLLERGFFCFRKPLRNPFGGLFVPKLLLTVPSAPGCSPGRWSPRSGEGVHPRDPGPQGPLQVEM